MSIRYVQINNPWFLEIDANGLPAAGYLVYTLAAGSVSTLVNTYSEHTLTVLNTNPIVLDVHGQANIFSNVALKLVYCAPGGTLASPIWTEDYVGEQQGTPPLLGGTATSDGHNTYTATTAPVLSALFDQMEVIITPNADNLGTLTSVDTSGVTGINDCTFSGPYVGSTSGSIFSVQIDGTSFQGSGLSDVTWGGTPLLGHVYTVKISTAAGTDKFQWRKDGGAWSAEISITGAAQALTDGVTITFAATTGHTLSDLWNNIDTFKWKKDAGAFTAGVAITAVLQNLLEGVGVTFAERSGHTLNDLWTLTVEKPVMFIFCATGAKIVYKNVNGVLKALDAKDWIKDIPLVVIYSVPQDAYIMPGPGLPVMSTQKPYRERIEIISAYTVQVGDLGKSISCTGTFALTWPAAATLANHWWWVRNSGTGTITLTANGTEKFKYGPNTAGASTLALYPGQMVMIATNGVDFQVAGYTTGGFVKRTYLTSGTSITTQATTRKIVLQQVGGGGGGGGAKDAAFDFVAGGGGSGGYAEKAFDVSSSTAYTYAIGAGGTAGAFGADGGVGGNTTFTVGATTVTALGGAGGKGSGVGPNTIALGGAGGTISTNGDLNLAGRPGDYGLATTTDFIGGKGGDSQFGSGGQARSGVGDGNAATGYGSGGGGAVSNTGGQVGGVGTAGLIIVTEYS